MYMIVKYSRVLNLRFCGIYRKCHNGEFQLSPSSMTLFNVLRNLTREIFTARNEVWVRLCFYTCLWFCSGGVCLSACWDIHPLPGANLPRSRPHLGADPPQEQCILGDMGNKRAVCILSECILVYVSLCLHMQNAVPAQPCVGNLGISLVLLNFLHCNFRLWFKTP